MKFGVHHNGYASDGQGYQITKTLNSLVTQAEKSGMDSFWLSDHFHQNKFVGKPEDPMLDSWTALAALAAVTSKVRLGVMVTATPYRFPTVLAKIGATVDVLSDGRLFMGIGAANYPEEAEAYGIPFPPNGERIRRLSEAVQIIRAMWSPEPATSFDGRYYKVKNAFCNPKPIQKPRPQILIGGAGEKLTLRVVARNADACNIQAGTPEAFKAKLDILAEHCKAVGRDYKSILKTKGGRIVIDKDRAKAEARVAASIPDPARRGFVIAGNAADVVKKLEAYQAVGLEYMITGFEANREIEGMKLFEQVMKSF